MTVRIGVAVATDAVRAVAVRRGRVVWRSELPLRGDSIEATVAEVLAAGRPGLWTRPVVIAAVGPARAQLRKLSGLPPVSKRGALAQVVGESAGRFFLRNGVPLVTSDVRRDGVGEGWSAAVEQPVVAALAAACRSRRLRLAAVFPTMAVLPSALRGDTLTWRDGDVNAEVLCDGGRIHSARRAIVGTSGIDAARPIAEAVPALSVLGDEGWRFADAYGAAIASVSDALAHRPARARTATVPRWRLLLAVTALALSTSTLMLAPGLIDQRSAARDTRTLAHLAKRRRVALSAESDLMHISAALNEVAVFDRDRRSMSLLMSDVARLMPIGSAIVTLRADSTGGTLVALTPRAAVLIGKLEDLPGISAPAIVGPVTREAAAGAEVERVTVRFRWTGLPAAAAGAKER